MLRTIGHCILLIVFVFISCFGLLYGGTLSKSKDYFDQYEFYDNTVELGGPVNFNAGKHLSRKVPLQEFRTITQKAKNYRDIYRIFLDKKNVSDEEVDKFLTEKTFKRALDKKERDYHYDYNDEQTDMERDIERVADEAYLHFISVKEHPLGSCNDPTPELVRIPPEGSKIYFPEYTILHVCRNVSGCCWNPSQECAEKEIEIINQSFIVAEIDHNKYGEEEVYIPEANKVEIKFFKNVTKCECKELKRLPRCDKECPFPFVKRRDRTECVCDCRDHHSLKCLEMKYGIEPLPAADFRCVKEGRCMKPKCETGELDMRKGYCPGTVHAKLKLYQRSKRDLKSIRTRTNDNRNRKQANQR